TSPCPPSIAARSSRRLPACRRSSGIASAPPHSRARSRARCRDDESCRDHEGTKTRGTREELFVQRVPVEAATAMRIYGINPVLEALRATRVTAIRVSARADDRLTAIVKMAEQQGIPVRRAQGDELARFARGGAHQGVVADVDDAASLSVEDLVAGA